MSDKFVFTFAPNIAIHVIIINILPLVSHISPKVASEPHIGSKIDIQSNHSQNNSHVINGL